MTSKRALGLSVYRHQQRHDRRVGSGQIVSEHDDLMLTTAVPNSEHLLMGLTCPYQKLSWPPTGEVNGTPCPLRPGSNLGSRASFHRKLDFASQTMLAAFSPERWEVFVDQAALRV